jgi:hypothetical protein
MAPLTCLCGGKQKRGGFATDFSTPENRNDNKTQKKEVLAKRPILKIFKKKEDFRQNFCF